MANVICIHAPDNSKFNRCIDPLLIGWSAGINVV